MNNEIKPPNFVSEGKVYLVRCPKCKKENWAPAVAMGMCSWCGFDGQTLVNKFVIKKQTK